MVFFFKSCKSSNVWFGDGIESKLRSPPAHGFTAMVHADFNCENSPQYLIPNCEVAARRTELDCRIHERVLVMIYSMREDAKEEDVAGRRPTNET